MFRGLQLVSDTRCDHPALASPYSLKSITHPILLNALDLWREMAPDGVLARSRHPLRDVLMEPRLVPERMCVICVTRDDPLDWPILMDGRGFQYRRDGKPLATQVRDLPWPPLALATAATYPEIVKSRKPAVHRLSLAEPGRVVIYDRVALPSSKRPGAPVDMLLTISVNVFRT